MPKKKLPYYDRKGYAHVYANRQPVSLKAPNLCRDIREIVRALRAVLTALPAHAQCPTLLSTALGFDIFTPLNLFYTISLTLDGKHQILLRQDYADCSVC